MGMLRKGKQQVIDPRQGLTDLRVVFIGDSQVTQIHSYRVRYLHLSETKSFVTRHWHRIRLADSLAFVILRNHALLMLQNVMCGECVCVCVCVCERERESQSQMV